MCNDRVVPDFNVLYEYASLLVCLAVCLSYVFLYLRILFNTSLIPKVVSFIPSCVFISKVTGFPFR